MGMAWTAIAEALQLDSANQTLDFKSLGDLLDRHERDPINIDGAVDSLGDLQEEPTLQPRQEQGPPSREVHQGQRRNDVPMAEGTSCLDLPPTGPWLNDNLKEETFGFTSSRNGWLGCH